MGRRGRHRLPGAPAGAAAGRAPRGPAQAAPPDRPRTKRARPRSRAEQTCLSEDRRGAGGACPPALPGAGARQARLAQNQPKGRRASAGSRCRAGHWPPCSLTAPRATTGQEHRVPWEGGAALRTLPRASRPPLLGALLPGRPRGPSGQWFSSVKAVCAAPVSTPSPPPASKLHVPAAAQDFGAHAPGTTLEAGVPQSSESRFPPPQGTAPAEAVAEPWVGPGTRVHRVVHFLMQTSQHRAAPQPLL